MGKEKQKEIYVVGNKKFFGAALKKSGIFDMDEMYKKWKQWFTHYHYLLNEKKQSSKTLPDGRELKMKWYAERKVDDYVKFHINIFVWAVRYNDIMVETPEGEKKKMQKADISVRFRGYFEKDYRGKWKTEILRQFYDRFIIKKRLTKMEGKIWFETNSLIGLTKRYLRMMTTM